MTARPRVLLADDYPPMVKAVSRMLAVDCEIVGTVSDGHALLEAAARLAPDVIVLDLNLPIVDGLTACRQITRLNPEIKVIMFTVLDDADASRVFFDSGAAAFVSKMTSLDLLPTIKRVCADPG